MYLQGEETSIAKENQDNLEVKKRKVEDVSQEKSNQSLVIIKQTQENEAKDESGQERKRQKMSTDESSIEKCSITSANSNNNNQIIEISKSDSNQEPGINTENNNAKTSTESDTHTVENTSSKQPTNFFPQSPKKRLEIDVNRKQQQNKKKEKFIYGNYSQYYGYRNKEQDFHDIRLDVFVEYSDLFKDKKVLDIGCNTGFITMEIAKKFAVNSIVGLDIDKHLINQAIKTIIKHKKALPMNNELKRQHKFPFNVTFVHGNYVLRDAVLLEIEKPQFNVILCLSITKWIHLNFGDDGLKLAFKRMFLQLHEKGVLILEAQPFDNYGRRKKMTDTIFTNYKNMKFFPKDFEAYLLSSEVGFTKMVLMGVPEHCKKGFKRPLQIFYKE